MVDTGGRLQVFEAKWSELPATGDAVNLGFVRNVVGRSRIAGAGIICRTPNSFLIADGVRALPVTELGELGQYYRNRDGRRGDGNEPGGGA